MLKANFILIISLLCTVYSYAAKYLLPNEDVIYSFTTTNGKKMMFAEDTSNKYLVYRFGTKDKIELEYYSKTTDSPKKFRYSSYYRPLTAAVYGLDEKYVAFYIGNIHYIIYDTHFQPTAEDNANDELKAGIFVIDTVTKKKVDIRADLKTKRGSIGFMYDDTRFSQGDELYEEE